MAIAGIHGTLLELTQRINSLNNDIATLQSEKRLAVYSQQDLAECKYAEQTEKRRYFKHLYENNSEIKDNYDQYTDIPDFEEAIDLITAKYQNQLTEIASWETQIDSQITTDSTELEEAKAYKESFKQMITTNISEDYNFGLNK